jgi:hypothetical protein
MMAAARALGLAAAGAVLQAGCGAVSHSQGACVACIVLVVWVGNPAAVAKHVLVYGDTHCGMWLQRMQGVAHGSM